MGRVTWTRRYQFQSVHSLNVCDLQERLHGHDFQLEVCCSSDQIHRLDELIKKEILPQIHGRNLNQLLSPATGELLVEWIDAKLRRSKLSPFLVGIALQETRKNRFVSAKSEAQFD